MGTPALTTRGFLESDFDKVAEFVDRAVTITQDLKKQTGPKLKDFREHLDKNAPPEIEELGKDVVGFATAFPTVGFEKSTMRYG